IDRFHAAGREKFDDPDATWPLGVKLASRRGLPLLVVATLTVSAATLTGCVNWAEVNTQNRAAVLRRAAFDFDCPEEKLAVTPIDEGMYPSQYGVRGCGHRAVYVDTVHSPGFKGNWVLDASMSGSRDAPQPSATPSATSP